MTHKTHPYADLFPMMTDAELDALTADIKENGLRQAIIKYQDMVLDGRNRLVACERAGVEPRFDVYPGDDAGALALVLSLNVQRRDLTSSQRAFVAARIWMANGATKGSGRRKFQSETLGVKRLAGQFKVSTGTITQARDLIQNAPDLAREVEAGGTGLAAVYAEWQKREQEAKRQAAERKRIAAHSAKYEEAIKAGTMTVDEAVKQMRADLEKAAHDAQARQLWFEKMEDILAVIKESIAAVDDDFLAWFTQPGAPGTETTITARHIAEAQAQLERIRTITFGERQHDSDRQAEKD